MAKHQARNGAFVTSYACKEGQHRAKCEEALAELTALAGAAGPAIVCHCSCHPACTRAACVTAREKAAQRSSEAAGPGVPSFRSRTHNCTQPFAPCGHASHRYE